MLKQLGLLAGAAAMFVTSAFAHDIKDDPGGNVLGRINKIAKLKKTGEKVRLIGACRSSCTLILTLPSQQVCATPNALLGFHAIAMAAKSGSDEPKYVKGKRVSASKRDQQAFTSFFPKKVQTWMQQNRVMSSFDMTYVPATDFIRSCSETEIADVKFDMYDQHEKGNIWEWKGHCDKIFVAGKRPDYCYTITQLWKSNDHQRYAFSTSSKETEDGEVTDWSFLGSNAFIAPDGEPDTYWIDEILITKTLNGKEEKLVEKVSGKCVTLFENKGNNLSIDCKIKGAKNVPDIEYKFTGQKEKKNDMTSKNESGLGDVNS